MAIYNASNVGVITDAGHTAALAAGKTGPMVDITGFTVGDTSAYEGATALTSDTAVSGNLVYTGQISQFTYTLVSSNTAKLTLTLEEDIGDFTVGNVGLMMGSVLFAKFVFARQENKVKDNAPTTVGNTFIYDLYLSLPQIASCINLTTITNNTASLPELGDETLLPPAATAPYPAYYLHNHTKIGVPHIASRRNAKWFFSELRETAGQAVVIPLTAAAFDSSVGINQAVYWDDLSGTFKIADATDTSGRKIAVGVRTSSFELTIKGRITNNNAAAWPTSLTPNSFLYVQGGSNAGNAGATPTYQHYGYVIDSSSVFVDFYLGRSFLNGKTPTGYQPNFNDHRHVVATLTTDGFMSAEDKANLTDLLDFIGTGTVVNKITNYSIIIGDSGNVFSNSGATAAVTFTLPNATLGSMIFTFAVTADKPIAVVSAQSMYMGSKLAASGVESSDFGSTLTFRSINGIWMVTSFVGTWALR